MTLSHNPCGITITFIPIGGYIFILANGRTYGKDREKYEATMKTNQDKGILNWTKTKVIQEYARGHDGIIYVFQKPNQ